MWFGKVGEKFQIWSGKVIYKSFLDRVGENIIYHPYFSAVARFGKYTLLLYAKYVTE